MVGFAIPLYLPMFENRLQCHQQDVLACVFFWCLDSKEHEVSGVPGLQQRVEQLEIQNLELTTNLETSNGWLKFSFSENQQMKAGVLGQDSCFTLFLIALQ